MTRAARAIATAMMMVSSKEGDGDGGMSNGDCNEGGGQQQGQYHRPWLSTIA
jgi:hypothetical protein